MLKRGTGKGLQRQVSEKEKLSKLVKVLEETFEKLKTAYEKKDSEEFNKLKKEIITTQRKIFNIK